MSMSMEELRQQLSAIEPDERTYRGIGSEEVPLLRRLLDDEERWLAARAVFALSRVGSSEAYSALEAAAEDQREEVRVAVAAASTSLPIDTSDALLERLLNDQSSGVRRFAIESVSERNGLRIRTRLQDIASADTDPYLRLLAQQQEARLRP